MKPAGENCAFLSFLLTCAYHGCPGFGLLGSCPLQCACGYSLNGGAWGIEYGSDVQTTAPLLET